MHLSARACLLLILVVSTSASASLRGKRQLAMPHDQDNNGVDNQCTRRALLQQIVKRILAMPHEGGQTDSAADPCRCAHPPENDNTSVKRKVGHRFLYGVYRSLAMPHLDSDDSVDRDEQGCPVAATDGTGGDSTPSTTRATGDSKKEPSA